MILPSAWQQTTTFSSVNVIGDVDPQGKSTFRNSKNKGPIVNGEWKSSLTTGYKYVTPNITSGSNIQKKKGSFGFFGGFC